MKEWKKDAGLPAGSSRFTRRRVIEQEKENYNEGRERFRSNKYRDHCEEGKLEYSIRNLTLAERISGEHGKGHTTMGRTDGMSTVVEKRDAVDGGSYGS